MSEGEAVSNHGLGEWAQELARLSPVLPDKGTAGLLDQLRGNKLASVAKLVELGLPHFRSTTGTVADFLGDSAPYFEPLTTELFYMSIEPRDTNLPRQRTHGIGKDDITDFVRRVRDTHGDIYDTFLLWKRFPVYSAVTSSWELAQQIQYTVN